MQTINCYIALITKLEPEAQQKIDSLIYEMTAKLQAIVEEMKYIRFSNLDDARKREKTDHLRLEFKKILNEQQKKVEEIMQNNNTRRGSRSRR
jgi:hypothetical protein